MSPRRKPRLLDLFCGAGGCSVGYHRAGFDVTGVDKIWQPSYTYRFKNVEALEYLDSEWHRFDVIHASPPCQQYSISTAHFRQMGKRYHDLVAMVRTALVRTGKPYVIENVVGSPLHNPITLCGIMFGLKVIRHRLFESNVSLTAPVHPRHPKHLTTGRRGVYDRGQGGLITVVGHNFCPVKARAAMGIDWMASARELSQAIPPAYTEHLGKQLLAAL